MRALLIDHERSRYLGYREWLRGESGIRLDWACDGMEACRLLRQRTYHLVVLEHDLPGESPEEVLAFLKRSGFTVPAVVITDTHLEGMEFLSRDLLHQDSFEVSLWRAVESHGLRSLRAGQGDAQLREAQKMEALGRLAGGVAHDFNNLLSVIGGYLEMLQDDSGLAAAERRGALGEIRQAVDRGASLTRQLLAFGSQQASVPKILQPARFLEELLPRLTTPGIRVLPELKCREFLRIDPTQLEQVIVNLIANARDACREGGNIRVRVEAPEREERRLNLPGTPRFLRIEVIDDGQGIQPEALKHVFEPFYSTKGRPGSGLGLAVVYAVVHHHGGFVRVESEPERGSVFTVYLPIWESSHPNREEELPPKRSDSPIVLVVDDEGTLRDMIARTLKRQNYQVLSAHNGVEALALLEEQRVDLVLTDVGMPSMGGTKLYEQLQAIHPNLPVLFMTGYFAEGQLPGGHAVLSKPFGTQALLQAVRSALRS